MSEFEKWVQEAIPPMAKNFAECTDAKRIEEALRALHLAWIGEVEDRLKAVARTDRVAKAINSLNP